MHILKIHSEKVKMKREFFYVNEKYNIFSRTLEPRSFDRIIGSHKLINRNS